MMDDQEREWVFTFGCGHENAGKFTKIFGTHEYARKELFRRFGQKWSMQYASEEEAGVAEWNLTEIH